MLDLKVARTMPACTYERRIGTIASLLMEEGIYRDQLTEHIENFMPCMYLDQCFFFINRFRKYCGIAFWAKLTEDVETQIIESGNFMLHESEWNEGDRFWVLGFVARKGCALEAAQLLRKEMLTMTPTFQFMRLRSDGRPLKVATVRSQGKKMKEYLPKVGEHTT
jgi:hemolysin-activating ACP:hemolysin acyltransferase